jgi:hypothetical protein
MVMATSYSISNPPLTFKTSPLNKQVHHPKQDISSFIPFFPYKLELSVHAVSSFCEGSKLETSYNQKWQWLWGYAHYAKEDFKNLFPCLCCHWGPEHQQCLQCKIPKRLHRTYNAGNSCENLFIDNWCSYNVLGPLMLCQFYILILVSLL